MAPTPPTGTLRSLRDRWFKDTAETLATLLFQLSPGISRAVPDDLGDRDLVAATVLARTAQADLQRRDIPFVAGDLVRLAGAAGVTGPERVGEVQELWLLLRNPTVPLLHAWWREALGDGLLARWAENRAEAVGWPRVHQELRERWSLDSDDIWRRGLTSSDGPGDDDWCGYFTYLQAHTHGQEAHFARHLLRHWDGLAEEIDAYASECAAELAAVPHLMMVHREQVLAEALTSVCEGNVNLTRP